MYLKVCRQCEIEFQCVHSSKLYCSYECYKKHEKENIKPKIIHVIKSCSYCKIDFMPHSHNQKYCNSDCQKKSWNDVYVFKNKSVFSIFHRDNFTCIYCGKSSIIDGIKLEIEHIKPVVNGGKNDIDNLITTCQSCNAAKKDIELNEDAFKMIYLELTKRNKMLTIENYFEIQRQISLRKHHDNSRKRKSTRFYKSIK